jgi:hypothetical protein
MFDFFGNQSPDVLNESLWSLLFCSGEPASKMYANDGFAAVGSKRVAAEKSVDKGKSPLWSFSDDVSGFSPSCVSMMPRSFVVEPLECGEVCGQGRIEFKLNGTLTDIIS